MPKLTAQQEASKQADETVIMKLWSPPYPRTQQQLGCTRHRLLKLMQEKLVKRSGEVKSKPNGRKAVTYELTAKGVKRAQKCSA